VPRGRPVTLALYFLLVRGRLGASSRWGAIQSDSNLTLCRSCQPRVADRADSYPSCWQDDRKHQGATPFPGDFCLSLTPYLDGVDVDPETEPVLHVALEMTRVALGLTDHHANGIISKRITELAMAGERNPDRLCEGALEKLRGHLSGTEMGLNARPPSAGVLF
jgi:hypothetical protein